MRLVRAKKVNEEYATEISRNRFQVALSATPNARNLTISNSSLTCGVLPSHKGGRILAPTSWFKEEG